MNPVLKWLGTHSKDRIAKLISTEGVARPVPHDLVCLEDLAYTSADSAPLEADAYRPADMSADPLPIAVFVHGGGFFVGDRKANRAYAELLAKRGYVVLVPDYRLIHETDGLGAIADVCATLAYVTSHAAEFGGDLTRVLMIGESAGAHLALYATALAHSAKLREALGIEAPELAVRGLACFSGMFYTTGNDPIGLVYRRDLYGDRLRDETFRQLVNPEDPRIESQLPPMLLATSGADFLKSYTLRYNRSLAMAGHAHRLIYYPRGKELTHAFPSLKPGLPQSQEVLDELDAWFRAL
ncbi:MAG: alpha/beta hydrolase [Coriobacteriales bacterium]|nr:alpha/beta hydrolase [Coriobacteriales bacterium]